MQVCESAAQLQDRFQAGTYDVSELAISQGQHFLTTSGRFMYGLNKQLTAASRVITLSSGQ